MRVSGECLHDKRKDKKGSVEVDRIHLVKYYYFSRMGSIFCRVSRKFLKNIKGRGKQDDHDTILNIIISRVILSNLRIVNCIKKLKSGILSILRFF